MAGSDPFQDWHVEALLAAAARRSARESAWLTLLIQTGFRPREILSCSIAAIADGTRVRQLLYIPRRRIKGGRGPRRRSVRGRSVPLTSQAMAAVSDHLVQRASAGTLAPDRPLFESRNHRPLSIWQANDILKELIREAGFEGAGRFSLHSGRKTYAMRIYRSSQCLITTRDSLGHAHVATSEAYLGDRYRQAMALTLAIWDGDTRDNSDGAIAQLRAGGLEVGNIRAVQTRPRIAAISTFPPTQELSS